MEVRAQQELHEARLAQIREALPDAEHAELVAAADKVGRTSVRARQKYEAVKEETTGKLTGLFDVHDLRFPEVLHQAIAVKEAYRAIMSANRTHQKCLRAASLFKEEYFPAPSASDPATCPECNHTTLLRPEKGRAGLSCAHCGHLLKTLEGAAAS